MLFREGHGGGKAPDWVLGDIPLADPKYDVPNKIDLLLGAAVYGQVVQERVKKNPEGTLLAQNTSLGWIISGEVTNQEKQEVTIVSMHTCVEDTQLKIFWELEADPKTYHNPILTEEEKLCEKLFAGTTVRDKEGRYVVRLPFKSENRVLKLENTKQISMRRLNLQLKRLNKDSNLKEKYKEVLKEYLQLGHMERIPENEEDKIEAVYLPHFAVVRNDKDTTKVRIVFDASCKGGNGKTLNDKLMIGPTLQPELRHLLMNRRRPRIYLSADIVKMYRKVKISEEDVDFQRILWKENESVNKAEEYRLSRVTFGTVSAPYQAVKVLQQIAEDKGADYPEAASIIKRDFYMDDLLTGCENVDTAMRIYEQINELLKKGRFQLQKRSSNYEEVLENICEHAESLEVIEGLQLKEEEIMKYSA